MSAGSEDAGGERQAVILTPDQRVRVFISSTLEELADERSAARRAIRRLRLAPVWYESGARPHPPRKMYRAYVEQSQVFVGIYWQRYGWVAPGMDISGLEDEYFLSADMPKLLYVKLPAPQQEPRLGELLDRIRIEGQVSYRTFSTPNELERFLADDLALLLSERFHGPIRRSGDRREAEGSVEERPSRTLTFLFTDVEGSTAMLQRLLGDAYAKVLTVHHRLIRAGLVAHDGKEIDTQGDAFFAAFSSPSACVAAAIEIQRAFVSYPWPAGEAVRVRMGIHSGEASETAVGLVGLDIHRAARVAAVAHGGQILVSGTTAAMVRDSMPVGASLKDLGLHRLKDLGRAEQIFQLEADGLQTAFPPLRSLDNPQLLNNLPAQMSSFIGRDAELAEVHRLITLSRLVTLTGSGGAGKTRLGLQVAAGLLDGSGDGVWFVDLAPLQNADLVAVTVANVLGIREDAGRSGVDTLVEAIGQRSLLLLLDNCEHVIDMCAKLADTLLRSCPKVTLLATSREPLGIDGERVHRIPSLDTPADDDDADVIRSTEAVRLFTDRAAQHGVALVWDERTTSVVGRICRLLDGIPLAIELGAARLRVMSVTELDARLDQRFSVLTGGSRAALPRQQTLLAMVDWSWELLNVAERRVLALLSVFAGGFDLAAVEAIAAGEGAPPDEVVRHLGALVDKSLVQF
ncbi:MAG TPA: DUF4062 domain-containing protein, partial [Acidimicrobiales bacterium]|nr:DUF4062 domain-containing protein [Acidimicrobiales bacterium]